MRSSVGSGSTSSRSATTTCSGRRSSPGSGSRLVSVVAVLGPTRASGGPMNDCRASAKFLRGLTIGALIGAVDRRVADLGARQVGGPLEEDAQIAIHLGRNKDRAETFTQAWTPRPPRRRPTSSRQPRRSWARTPPWRWRIAITMRLYTRSSVERPATKPPLEDTAAGNVHPVADGRPRGATARAGRGVALSRRVEPRDQSRTARHDGGSLVRAPRSGRAPADDLRVARAPGPASRANQGARGGGRLPVLGCPSGDPALRPGFQRSRDSLGDRPHRGRHENPALPKPDADPRARRQARRRTDDQPSPFPRSGGRLDRLRAHRR